MIDNGMEFPDINRDYLPLLARLYNEDYGHANAVRGHVENGNSFEISNERKLLRQVCPGFIFMEAICSGCSSF